ncbi:MAG: type II and III secretion system protein family protein [Proteobacteria bacterium]|nr:type II and III secretion system protein family protein [Pseudomonadota bacterium]
MRNSPGTKAVKIASVFLVLVFILGFPSGGSAGDPAAVISQDQRPNKLSLLVGKSIIIRSTKPVKRVSLAAPEIADFVLLSPSQIYLTGKTPGITNLTLWENEKISAIYDLEVAPDVSRLKEKLHAILPGEEDLRVIATHDSITLAGTISSTANLSQALALAGAYIPNNKVINLVQVAGVHQVMLDVRVAEMSRSLMKRLGVNFNYLRKDDFGISLLNNLTRLVDPDQANLGTPGAPFGIFVSPSVNALFRFTPGSATWTGFIDALKEDGLVKILAEPTLISLSGQTASFLAGGEFPIPIPQGLGTVAIEYKTFGVGLNFTPTVLSERQISIQVTPEVSELDFSTAALLEGFVVPGLTTRRASTVIELRDGQSFAIAGLLRENVREIISKFPLLGDIPILGALFRSSAFQKNETELIIIVTPHLVKPLDLTKQSLPTDGYIEPSDTEFFLLGILEGREKTKSSGTNPSLTHLDKTGGLEGEFGHTIP